MKLTLAIVLIGLVCQTLGNPLVSDEKKSKHEICATECNISSDLQARIPQFNYKNTAEDKCYNLCLGRLFGNIDEDGKIKTDKMEQIFTANGLKVPDDMNLLKDTSSKDENFMDNVSQWINNNKQDIKVIFEKMFPPKTVKN